MSAEASPRDYYQEYLEERRKNFEAVKVGDSFWCVPWAVDLDTEGTPWLRAGFVAPRSTPPEPYETPKMLVTLTGEMECTVDITRCPDYDWNSKYPVDPEDTVNQDSDNPEWLLVTEVTR